MSQSFAEVSSMPPSIWEDIILAADQTGALEERREALLRVLRPGRLIQAGRSLGEEANLQGALGQVASDSFHWIMQRTLRGCATGEHQALDVSLTGLLTLFAACQAQHAGDIETMRRLTL